MRKHAIRLLLILVCLGPLPLFGQQPTDSANSPDDAAAIHDELRALKKDLTDALVAVDVDRTSSFAHKNVVTTWQNSEVTRGLDELKAFQIKMNQKNQRVFQGYKQPPEPDDLSILFGGDTAIAFGSSVPHYKILGMEFDLHDRWTATLVKEDGRWLIASFHVSANILDNPVLTAAKSAAYWTGGIALVIGIALGLVGSAIVKRIRSRAA